jgi:hypothetical protein
MKPSLPHQNSAIAEAFALDCFASLAMTCGVAPHPILLATSITQGAHVGNSRHASGERGR